MSVSSGHRTVSWHIPSPLLRLIQPLSARQTRETMTDCIRKVYIHPTWLCLSVRPRPPPPAPPSLRHPFRAAMCPGVQLAGRTLKLLATVRSVTRFGMPIAGLPAAAETALMPCSQTTTFSVGRSSERGTTPLSSCDSNPTPALHQPTWRTRTTRKASTSDGSPQARSEGIGKDPGYEMNSQQQRIRQVVIILTFPP